MFVATALSSAYPNRYGWNQGYFGGWSAWTLWQYSYQNQPLEAGQPSAITYGFTVGYNLYSENIDCDIVEGTLDVLLRPTPVSALYPSAGNTSITLTWVTGESDVRGYMFSVDGGTTATITTGLGTYLVEGLEPNTPYTVTGYTFDYYEISKVTSTSITTNQAVDFYHTLLCFKLD
jgi:hypothetical protein